MISLEELSRLDVDGANELVFAYVTDIKRLGKEAAELEKAVELWRSRVALAEGKGLTELAEGAKKQLAETESRKASIEASAAELTADVQRIKEALPGIKAKVRSIDPDKLAAELAMMTGEAMDPGKADLDREFNSLDKAGNERGTESALEALKRRMGL